MPYQFQTTAKIFFGSGDVLEGVQKKLTKVLHHNVKTIDPRVKSQARFKCMYLREVKLLTLLLGQLIRI